MAKTSTVNIAVSIIGDGTSDSYAPIGSPMVNLTAPYGGTVPVALASGANTLTPPTGTQGVIIVPPIGSVVTKTLKGVTGDMGIPINNTLPTVISLPSGAGAFVVTASSTETITVLWL